jgi:hypothetical protein
MLSSTETVVTVVLGRAGTVRFLPPAAAPGVSKPEGRSGPRGVEAEGADEEEDDVTV